MSKVRIKWVRGNRLPLLIPMEKITITDNGTVKSDYVPPVGSTIIVNLRCGLRNFQYVPSFVNEHTLKITDDGNAPTGVYDVEVNVKEPDGTPRRSKWNYQIEIKDSNDGVVDEYDDFIVSNGEILDGTIFLPSSDMATVISDIEMDNVLS